MSSRTKLHVVILAAAVLGLLFCPGFLFGPAAEEEPTVSPVEGAAPLPGTAEETLEGAVEPGPTVAITPAGLISFDFREAPIRDVLRLFADRVKINIVCTPAVQGNVSMKLDNVKWRRAMELILEVNKLKMTEDKENNVIKVMTEEEVAKEPLTTKVYTLNYIQAADYEVGSVEYQDGRKVKTTRKMDGAAKLLEPLLAENETIQADPGGNKIIVHAIPETHDRLQSAIEELDRKTMQVLIEVKFIEASTEAGKNLGIKWDFLREYGVEAFGPGSDEKRERMGRSWEKFRDREQTTSLSGSRVITSSQTESSMSGGDLSGLTRDISDYATSTLGTNQVWNAGRSAVKWATLSPDNVRMALSALFEDTDAKLVSNPRISTVDNRQAVLRAVKEWPIPRWQYNSDTGGWEVQGFDYKDIGITLKVTPHINQDMFITMDVDPEVSNQAGTVVFGGGAGGQAEIPIVDSRNATTRVVVKSGETLVIGGLVKTDELTVKSGVPLLKDIPLLGYIFKHSSKTQVNFDLLVFITPTIVEGPTAAVLTPPAELIGETTTKAVAEEAK